jgi:hypothetical protein
MFKRISGSNGSLAQILPMVMLQEISVLPVVRTSHSYPTKNWVRSNRLNEKAGVGVVA